MKKIILNRETLRNLDSRSLDFVWGGGKPATVGPPNTMSCTNDDNLHKCTCPFEVTV